MVKFAEFVSGVVIPDEQSIVGEDLERLLGLTGAELLQYDQIPKGSGLICREGEYAIVGWLESPKKDFLGRRVGGKPSFYWEFKQGCQVKVAWSRSVEKDCVYVRPRVAGWHSSSDGRIYSQIPQVLASLGFETQVIPFPEPVVMLPVPAWVQAWTWDGTSSGVESFAMFLSEAKEAALEFARLLTDQYS